MCLISIVYEAFLLALLTSTILASPLTLIRNELETRRMPIGNQKGLKCGNAPDVIAGK